MNQKTDRFLEIPAIAITQGNGRDLYAFAMDGKQLHDFAQISRLGRGDDEHIAGYQRPEVLSHIAEIRTYLESEGSMLPNAIVVAFDSRVRFRPLHTKATGSGPRHGHLLLPEGPDAEKPGWIVDGQQRAAALRDARIGVFHVFITAFITDSVTEQREQFILVNSTKPLPKGLIYELLPTTDMQLSSHLERRRFPAYLLERLNYDSRSPLHLAIQTPTNPFVDSSARNRRGLRPNAPKGNGTEEGLTPPTAPAKLTTTLDLKDAERTRGFIKDNSVLKMIENSLHDGALYRCRLIAEGDDETERMLELLFNFWSAVICVFKEAWALPPKRSRLTHGVGIVSMGHLMDAIADRYRSEGMPSKAQFAADLTPLRSICSWTDGYWHFGGNENRKWDEVQNTSKDIRLVANYLLVQYKRLVWTR